MKHLVFITIIALHFTALPAQTIQKLSASEARAYLAKTNPDSLLVIDGRSDEMYQSGHLQKAINIDAYQENLADQLNTALRREQLLIYCTKSTRSDSIIKTLTGLGYKGNIVQISEGITGWKAQGFEVILPQPNEGEANKE